MHKTAQQLIREAYEAANGLPPASAALLKELASRLDISMAATSQACDERSAVINTLTATRVNSGCPEGVDVQDWVKQLAAENVAIKSMNDCLSEELRGHESDGAFDGPMMHLIWWKAAPPATDRIVDGIKADGAEACVRALATSDDDYFTDAPNICAQVARSLREVSANG